MQVYTSQQSQYVYFVDFPSDKSSCHRTVRTAQPGCSEPLWGFRFDFGAQKLERSQNGVSSLWFSLLFLLVQWIFFLCVH